jgi:hypothetical protein
VTPRDYEMEDASRAVAGLVTESIERALTVGSPGSQAGTPGKALTSLFGRAKRESGIGVRNVLALTPSAVRVFACTARGARPVARREVVAWPRDAVRIETVTAEQWSAFNASHSGSVTNHFYVITLTPTDGSPRVELECPRTDSARATIQAIEDATGSPPSKITARRRAKQAASGGPAAEPEAPAPTSDGSPDPPR